VKYALYYAGFHNLFGYPFVAGEERACDTRGYLFVYCGGKGAERGNYKAFHKEIYNFLRKSLLLFFLHNIRFTSFPVLRENAQDANIKVYIINIPQDRP